MGYDVTANGDFTLRAGTWKEAREAILLVCAKTDGYKSVEEWIEAEGPEPNPMWGANYDGFVEYIDDRLEHFVVGQNDEDGIFFISPEDRFKHEEEDMWLFNAAAPFCTPESSIHFEGEDGCQWRWDVVNGALEEVLGDTVFGRDIKAPAILEEIVELLYRDGKPLCLGGSDAIGTLDAIENLIREGGFGPQAGMSELDRVAAV